MKQTKRAAEDNWGERARALDQWYSIHGRDLPWRQSRDPYRIWISEIMLQQTQVSRVIDYYQRWLCRLPTLNALAEADEATVIDLWQGLGYYSRGRNLLKAARLLRDRGHGTLPDDPHLLRQLPGMGPYTVGAICAIAWDMALPAIDGNVRRVMSRLMDLAEDPSRGDAARDVAQAVETFLSRGKPHRLIQALMDLGSSHCSPQAHCDECPVSTLCLARQRGTVSLRPVTKPRKKLLRRHGAALLLRLPSNEIVVRQRPPSGLWASFWEIPWIVAQQDQSAHEALTDLLRNHSLLEPLKNFHGQRTMKFTTWQVCLHLWLGITDRLPEGYCALSAEKLMTLPMPLGLKKLVLQALESNVIDERRFS